MEVIEVLVGTGLPCSLEICPDAVLVDEGRWLTRNWFEMRDGILRVRKGVDIENVELLDFELPVAEFEDKATGIEVYKERPSHRSSHRIDMRSTDDLLREALAIVERVRRDAADPSPQGKLEDAFGKIVYEAKMRGTSHDERVLGAVFSMLSKQRRLTDIFPDVVSTIPRFAKEVSDHVETEKARRLVLLEDELGDLRSVSQGSLREVEDLIAEKQAELEKLSGRIDDRLAYAAEIESSVQNRIEQTVSDLYGVDPGRFATLVERGETALARLEEAPQPSFDRQAPFELRSMLEDEVFLGQLAVKLARTNTPANVEETGTLETREQRSAQLAAVASKVGVRPETLSMIFGYARSRILPVLAGRYADATASAFSVAVGGSATFVHHCNPTLVSFDDLFVGSRERSSAFAKACEFALHHPDRIVPVVLKKLDLAPFSFWLDAVFDRVSTTGIPANLVVVATFSGSSENVSPATLDRTVGISCLEAVGDITPTLARTLLSWSVPEPLSDPLAAEVLLDLDLDGLPETSKGRVGEAVFSTVASVRIESVADLQSAYAGTVPWFRSVPGKPDTSEPFAEIFDRGA